MLIKKTGVFEVFSKTFFSDSFEKFHDGTKKANGSVASNNKKRSHTQLDSRKQVIAFQDRVITINIKEAQHPLK